VKDQKVKTRLDGSWRNKRTNREIIFEWTNTTLMILVCSVTLYPIWYILINSFNDGSDAMLGGIFWWPRKFSIENYKLVFSDMTILKAFAVSMTRTLIGTVTNVLFTAMVAYPLSKDKLKGRAVYMMMGTITMFFAGGLIPSFILLKKLALLDKFLVYIIPALFNFFNLLIFISFFREIPAALEESASIDGANEWTQFTKIILPLSKPVLATIALFTGVYHWNDYFAGVIYINNPDLQPIQTYLYRMVAESGSNSMQMSAVGVAGQTTTSLSIKLATMVVAAVPIICVYPFLQKYFEKGMMLGAVKE